MGGDGCGGALGLVCCVPRVRKGSLVGNRGC